MAKELGIAHEFHSPDEVTRLYLLVSLKGVVGALYTPDDGHVDPAMATQSFAIGACQGGAEINCHTKVIDLAQRPGGEWDVEIDKGTIAAGVVVNATGLRSDEIAALAGNFLPLVPIQLQHLVTEAIPEVVDLETELPVLGGLDGSFYLRQELDGIAHRCLRGKARVLGHRRHPPTPTLVRTPCPKTWSASEKASALP